MSRIKGIPLCPIRISRDHGSLYIKALVATDEPLMSMQQGWKPPPNDHIKVNWDATINSKKGCVELGIVARNSRGGIYRGPLCCAASED
jgi:hypothetical protein